LIIDVCRHYDDAAFACPLMSFSLMLLSPQDTCFHATITPAIDALPAAAATLIIATPVVATILRCL